jgi:hypothetical protein
MQREGADLTSSIRYIKLPKILKLPSVNLGTLIHGRLVEANTKKTAKSTQRLMPNTRQLPRLFSVFFLSYKANSTARLPPVMEAFSQNGHPSAKSRRKPSDKAMPILLDIHPTKVLAKGNSPDGIILPPVAIAPNLNTFRRSARTATR